MDQFGLTCTEDEPCPVFLEVSSADSGAGRIVVAGDLHTKNQTLYGVVLSSEDNGLTWKDGFTRIPFGSLEQVQFLDLQTGWISGESLDPLARNPFFLITTDGGKTWRQKLIFEDTKYGTVAQFHFDTAMHGQFILDASQGRNIRQELYETNTGGESWEVRETSNKKLQISAARPGSYRVRVDAKSDTYVIERGAGRSWDAIASFQVHAADCGAPVPVAGKDAE
ncbi:MAG: hypothetical protein ABL967_02915 [Bryobacteraceae bacterium]